MEEITTNKKSLTYFAIILVVSPVIAFLSGQVAKWLVDKRHGNDSKRSE